MRTVALYFGRIRTR